MQISIEVMKLQDGRFKVAETSNAIFYGGFDIFSEISEKKDFELTIYSNDSFHDLKNKLGLAFNISACEIYLFDLPDYKFEYPKEYIQEFTETEDGFPVFNDIYQQEINWINQEHFLCRTFIKKKIRFMPIKNFISNLESTNKLFFFTIRLFYPYFTSIVLKSYIDGNTDIYPILFPSKSAINRLVEGSDNFNKALHNSEKKNFSDNKIYFKNESLINGENNNKSQCYISITNINILLEERGIVNPKSLFDGFQTSKEIPIIRFFTKTLIYTKLYEEVKIDYYKSLKNIRQGRSGSVIFVCGESYIEVFQNKIYCSATFSDLLKIDFVKIYKQISKSVLIFNNYIKNLIFNPFNSEYQKKIMHLEKIRGTITLDYFFDHTCLQVPGITKKEGEKYYWIKAVQKIPENPENQFSSNYLWENCYFTIQETKKSTLILFVDLNEEYFKIFSQFLFYQSGKNLIDKKKVKWDKVKLLRFEDNKAYDSNFLKKGEVFARFCQTKEKQPLIISEEEEKEIKNKKRILHHWNYSLNKPAIFYCDSDKFPFPYFITGRHVDNYCLVCCKKTGNKKDSKHEACQKEHFYDENTKNVSSRYVNIYKKKLEPGRVGQLHPLISQFLIYNTSNINIISESISMRIFHYKSRIYSIDKIFKITKSTKVQEFDLKYFENFLHVPVWKRKRKTEALIKPIDVLMNPTKNRKFVNHMKRIKDSDLTFPIYIYKVNEGYIIIDGMHRISKAFMEKRKKILVKIVTRKQLERAEIGKYKLDDKSFVDELKEIKGGDDKKVFYYKIGVERYYKKINCSAGFSIAKALNMDFETYLKTLARLIECPDLNNFIDILDKGVDRNWNEFFIKQCYLFNIFPVIFEDTDDKLNLVLYEEIKNFSTKKDFQFLFLIVQKEQILMDINEYFYFPIFVIIPYAYFKNEVIEKKLFYYDESLVRNVEILLSNNKNEDFSVYDLEKIDGICQLDYGCCFVKSGDLVMSSFNIKGNYKKLKYKDVIMSEKEFKKEFSEIKKIHFFSFKNNVEAAVVGENIFPFSFPVSRISSQKPTTLNYSLSEIFSGGKMDFMSKYYKLCESRNAYSLYKKKIFETNPDIIEKPHLIKGEFADELRNEINDPIKRELFKTHSYIFEDLFFQKNKKEKIFVKWNKKQ